MENTYSFNFEKHFLEKHDKILSQMVNRDSNLTPDFFEKNENLIEEVIYIEVDNFWRQQKHDINKILYKLKEGYYVYLHKTNRDSQYGMKVYFDNTKKYSDVLFQINRLNKA